MKKETKRRNKLQRNGWQKENDKWITPPKDSQGYEYYNEDLMRMSFKIFNETIKKHEV